MPSPFSDMPHRSEGTRPVLSLTGFSIRIYRTLLSPLLHQGLVWPAGCRFVPTCSGYAEAALRQYGLRRGFVFLWRRLARCHPFSVSPGGCDPLP